MSRANEDLDYTHSQGCMRQFLLIRAVPEWSCLDKATPVVLAGRNLHDLWRNLVDVIIGYKSLGFCLNAKEIEFVLRSDFKWFSS